MKAKRNAVNEGDRREHEDSALTVKARAGSQRVWDAAWSAGGERAQTRQEHLASGAPLSTRCFCCDDTSVKKSKQRKRKARSRPRAKARSSKENVRRRKRRRRLRLNMNAMTKAGLQSKANPRQNLERASLVHLRTTLEMMGGGFVVRNSNSSSSSAAQTLMHLRQAQRAALQHHRHHPCHIRGALIRPQLQLIVAPCSLAQSLTPSQIHQHSAVCTSHPRKRTMSVQEVILWMVCPQRGRFWQKMRGLPWNGSWGQ